jgi:hypothetical protein
MTQILQKDSVIKEVKAILGSSYDSSVSAKDQLSDEQFIIIKNNIANGIINGTIAYSREILDEKEIKKYVSGMVSNYLRKVKELNGGVAYTPSFIASNSRDPQLSELNKLSKSYVEGSSEFNQIQEAILARKAELELQKNTATKDKNKLKEINPINMNALPDSLKNLAMSLVDQISK